MISDLLPFYVEIFVELSLSAAAVYYAYRLTRLTGTFGAWTLIIVGLVLMTLQNVNSLSTLLTLPEAQLVALIQQLGIASLAISAIFSIGIPAIFFLAMRKLYKSFEGQLKSRKGQTQSKPIEKTISN